MSWVTIIWSMSAGACLTLGVVHLLVWQRGRDKRGHLFFSLSAFAASAIGACELLALHADTVERYGAVLWWAQWPIWVLVVAVVSFMRTYLRAGRRWLAWSVIATRTLTLALNLFSTPNINFLTITDLHYFAFLGETVAIAEGTLNPWSNVGKLSSALLFFFLVDVALEVWRRGERSRALYLGGSTIAFIALAAVHAALVERGLVESPYLISSAYLGILLAMAYESSRDVLRAAQLGHELQESEQKLRESDERMDLAAQAANIGIWVHDLERDHFWASDRWRALFGFAATERVDFESFVQRVHPEDREAVRHVLESPTPAEAAYDREHRIALPDGSTRWIGSRGRVEFAADGKALRRRGASQDITARKEAELEAALRRTEAEYLARVTTLGEISGSLAHEVNQPLSAILANAVAAERHLGAVQPDFTELRAILADINRDGIRASEIVKGIRTFLTRKGFDRQPHDLAELVADTVRLLRSDAIARNVAINVELPPDLPAVAVDAVHLQQVLLNLLVNAMDAMEDCSPPDRRITIRAACSDVQTVQLDVCDTGVGIPPESLQRVFDSFVSTKQDGLGLGLSICRSIVQAHGGSIALQNNPGRGATACVTLPAYHSGNVGSA